MKINSYLEKITKALEEYRSKVDSLEEISVAERKQFELKVQEMKESGMYNDEYIKTFSKQFAPKIDYVSQMQTYRSVAEPVLNCYLSMIEKELDKFFVSPARQEYASNITSIATSGLLLNDREFDLMKKQAQNYMELRLLEQLAQSRTAEKTKSKIDEQGNVHMEKVQVENPYFALNIPNIDVVYAEFNSYKNNANTFLNMYSGKNGELRFYMPDDVSEYIYITADAYFRMNSEKKLQNTVSDAMSVLPENKIKRSLNENEKQLINVLIDERYPSLAKEKVRDIAEHSPELAELISLDERYS